VAFRGGRHRVGGDDGTLQVRTYREGIAQKVGHDLIIDVGQWEAAAEVREDGTLSAVQLDADPRSLQVREGLHGVKSLTDKDRGDIRKTITEKILRGRPIVFRSTAVDPGNGALTVRGGTRARGYEAAGQLRAHRGGRRPRARDAARDPERVGDQALSGDDGRAQGARHHRSHSRRAATVGLSPRSCFARKAEATQRAAASHAKQHFGRRASASQRGGGRLNHIVTPERSAHRHLCVAELVDSGQVGTRGPGPA
jgi:hypothetical protein